MRVAKVVWACGRDESGLIVCYSGRTICFISDDTMQPTLYACPELTGRDA